MTRALLRRDLCLQMLHYGLSDIHFAHCDAKCLHQLNRIVVGASRCAESGHSYANYAATLYAEEINALAQSRVLKLNPNHR